jgi:hypothetical protein
MIRPIALLGLALLAGCNTGFTTIEGRQVKIFQPDLYTMPSGERVVDMEGTMRLGNPFGVSDEAMHYISAAGTQRAQEICKGPAELLRFKRDSYPYNFAQMRFRCL